MVFMPGKSHGERSLVGYSPWGCEELDMTENPPPTPMCRQVRVHVHICACTHTHTHTHIHTHTSKQQYLLSFCGATELFENWKKATNSVLEKWARYITQWFVTAFRGFGSPLQVYCNFKLKANPIKIYCSGQRCLGFGVWQGTECACILCPHCECLFCASEGIACMDLLLFFTITLQNFSMANPMTSEDIDQTPQESGVGKVSPVYQIQFLPCQRGWGKVIKDTRVMCVPTSGENGCWTLSLSSCLWGACAVIQHPSPPWMTPPWQSPICISPPSVLLQLGSGSLCTSVSKVTAHPEWLLASWE